MPVNLSAPDPADLHPVAGLRIGTAMAGIRKANRRDLVVFLLDEGAAVAGVFTKNRFCAAPVQLCQAHLAAGGGQRPFRPVSQNCQMRMAAARQDHAHCHIRFDALPIGFMPAWHYTQGATNCAAIDLGSVSC